MTNLHNAILYTCMVLWYQLMVRRINFLLTFQLSVLPSSPGEKWTKCEETLLFISQGQKWNFPSVLWTWNHWPFSTNPVEDRAKCRMCMTFGSIHCRIGGDQSMKCQISRSRDKMGNFIPRPSCVIAMHYWRYPYERSNVGEDCYTQTHLPCYNPEVLVYVKLSNHWVYLVGYSLDWNKTIK